MTDLIVTVVVLAIVGFAVGHIVKAKRSGKKCIGCPDGGSCGSGCESCNCGHKE